MENREQGGIAVPCVRLREVFTSEECGQIIALGASGPLGAGRVAVSAKAGQGIAVSYEVDTARRNVETSYHERSDQNAWIYERLDACFRASADIFGFDIGAVEEAIKFMKYPAGGHFNTWHADTGPDYAARRKISISVELSEEGSYEGGFLEIFPDCMGGELTVPRGGAVLFPSFRYHRVTPVLSGTRYALVNWVSGPEFR